MFMSRVSWLLLLQAVLLAASAGAGPWTGGLLYSRFGVTLDVEKYNFGDAVTPKEVYRFNNSWTPSTPPHPNVDVDYIVNDFYAYPGEYREIYPAEYGSDFDGHVVNDPTYSTPTEPAGGEIYDVEAMYMTNDEHNIYLAIVTSVPPPPGIELDEGEPTEVTISTGDLAIHTQDDGGGGGDYYYGIDINHADTGENSVGTDDTIGSEMYQTEFFGKGADGDDWYTANLLDAVGGISREDTNFYGAGLAGSKLVGDATDGIIVKYLDTSLQEGYEETETDPDATTWEVNVVIPIDLMPEFRNIGRDETREMGFSFTPGCRNDGNDTLVSIELRGEYHDVPEPGTFIMTGLGLLGLALLRRRRNKADQ